MNGRPAILPFRLSQSGNASNPRSHSTQAMFEGVSLIGLSQRLGFWIPDSKGLQKHCLMQTYLPNSSGAQAVALLGGNYT